MLNKLPLYSLKIKILELVKFAKALRLLVFKPQDVIASASRGFAVTEPLARTSLCAEVCCELSPSGAEPCGKVTSTTYKRQLSQE